MFIQYIHDMLTFCQLNCRFHGTYKYPFGSTSVRTAPLIRKDEINGPGPAHYQRRRAQSGKAEGGRGGEGETSKPSCTFASTTSRLYSPPNIVTVRLSLHTVCTYYTMLLEWFCVHTVVYNMYV